MKTISHDKDSLLLWENNRNGSNLKPVNCRLYMKEHYLNLFRNIQEKLQTGMKFISIVDLWNKEVYSEERSIEKRLRKDFPNIHLDDIESFKKIMVKFRGNAGEIFAEAFFKAGYGADICENDSYLPVDPHKERFIDATAISAVDGLPIGIQVKNYSEPNLVKHEVFMKASAENMLWISMDRRIDQKDLSSFLASPHQVILAFTDAHDIFKEEYSSVVAFYGKNYIDSRNLQGSAKLGLPAKWNFFKKIADEIESFV